MRANPTPATYEPDTPKTAEEEAHEIAFGLDREPSWTDMFDSAARLLAKAQVEIDALTDTADDDQLRTLLAASLQASKTNCWWAIYRVAQEVRKIAEFRLGVSS